MRHSSYQGGSSSSLSSIITRQIKKKHDSKDTTSPHRQLISFFKKKHACVGFEALKSASNNSFTILSASILNGGACVKSLDLIVNCNLSRCRGPANSCKQVRRTLISKWPNAKAFFFVAIIFDDESRQRNSPVEMSFPK